LHSRLQPNRRASAIYDFDTAFPRNPQLSTDSHQHRALNRSSHGTTVLESAVLEDQVADGRWLCA